MSIAALQGPAMDRVWEVVRLVEIELATQVGSQVRLVAEIGHHTLAAGGKRLRPALVSLSALATGRPFDSDRATRLGACMEMIHMATLIHDDVIDHAPTRRGRPTAAATFGNTASILSGDVLLSKAMALLATDGDINIIRCVSGAVVQMAEGEVLELEYRGRFDLSEDDHLRVLEMKTAVFIQACCEVGAFIAGSGETERLALASYGHHLGLAFQIVDDLLDYRGDQVKMGKQQAIDFREGCATLPLIKLREAMTDAERVWAEERFGNGVAEKEILEVVEWMERRGSFAQTFESAARHIQLASQAMKVLTDSAERKLLESVGEFVLERQA